MSTSESTSELDQVRGMHCGRHEHDAWKRGEQNITRWLGSYDATMPLAEVHARFEHEKLTQDFRDGYERGWNSVLPGSAP